jgi:hypothetical protein
MSAAGHVSCVFRVNMKAKQLYRLPVQLQHATNRVGEIRILHTMTPTVPWSCEVKEAPVIGPCYTGQTQFPHKNSQLLHLAQENGVM